VKTCPYCAEEIQDAAIKCRHCGEWLEADGGEATERGSATTPARPRNYEVWLLDTGGQPRRVIKHIREVSPLTFAGAKSLIDHVPARVHTYLLEVQARQLAARLDDAGAKTEVREVTSSGEDLALQFLASTEGTQRTPVFAGYHSYQNAPTRKDLQKDVVVKTLPRMTAPFVRRRLIEDMALNGYSATNIVRTTTGKTIITFTRSG
jgi:ribosomal protein L7/L12